jgi:MOSC domain-containing protein YiiM
VATKLEETAMLNPRSGLAALLAAPMRPGHVVWIGLRRARREPLTPVGSVMAEVGKGLAGDHYRTRNNGKRQVTLIQAEHLAAIAAYLGGTEIDPALLRRNIAVAGINLLALKDKRLRVGDAILEYSGECHPCSRMEETLGVGGYNAVRGHGGITARVISGGEIWLGAPVYVAQSATQQ